MDNANYFWPILFKHGIFCYGFFFCYNKEHHCAWVWSVELKSQNWGYLHTIWTFEYWDSAGFSSTVDQSQKNIVWENPNSICLSGTKASYFFLSERKVSITIILSKYHFYLLSDWIFWENPTLIVCLGDSLLHLWSVRVYLGQVHLKQRCLTQ